MCSEVAGQHLKINYSSMAKVFFTPLAEVKKKIKYAIVPTFSIVEFSVSGGLPFY